MHVQLWTRALSWKTRTRLTPFRDFQAIQTCSREWQLRSCDYISIMEAECQSFSTGPRRTARAKGPAQAAEAWKFQFPTVTRCKPTPWESPSNPSRCSLAQESPLNPSRGLTVQGVRSAARRSSRYIFSLWVIGLVWLGLSALDHMQVQRFCNSRCVKGSR